MFHKELARVGRPSENFDEDEVRQHLTKGLAFSRVDQEGNVRGIVFVPKFHSRKVGGSCRYYSWEPNYYKKHEGVCLLMIDRGPGLKTERRNSLRFGLVSGDGVSCSFCADREIALQLYMNRAYLACGSRMKPILGRPNGIATYGIVNPMYRFAWP